MIRENNLETLDIINIMSFIIQMQNLEEDKKYKGSVQQFEDMVQQEVDKLHKENDLIMQKLDEIQTELRQMKYIRGER